MRYRFEAETWPWTARTDSWVFATVPASASAEIRDIAGDLRRGFGSVPVRVRLGGSEWTTSVFPDADSGCYVMAIKKAVRTAEGIELGDTVEIDLELRI